MSLPLARRLVRVAWNRALDAAAYAPCVLPLLVVVASPPWTLTRGSPPAPRLLACCTRVHHTPPALLVSLIYSCTTTAGGKTTAGPIHRRQRRRRRGQKTVQGFPRRDGPSKDPDARCRRHEPPRGDAGLHAGGGIRWRRGVLARY